MKKYQKLVLSCLLIIGLGCFTGFEVKKEDDLRTLKSALAGTWTLHHYDLTIHINDLEIYEYLTKTAGYTKQRADNTKKIFEELFSGVITEYGISFHPNGTYTSKVEGLQVNGSWTIDETGTILTLTGVDHHKDFQINQTTPNHFQFESSDHRDLDLNEDGAPEKILITSSIRVVKE